MGTLFIGIAFGPTIGSLIIHISKDILTPYYVAITLHILLILTWSLIVPESLSMEARVELAKKRREELNSREDFKRQAKASGTWSLARRFGALFSFFAPLLIFLPKKIEGTRRRDWNLTLLIGANAVMFSFLVSRSTLLYEARLTLILLSGNPESYHV